MKCECCRRADAQIKDFRFINSIGCQGKVPVCAECFRLNDILSPTEVGSFQRR